MSKDKVEVKVNRQFYDCLKSKQRHLIHVGGSRSAKTYSILQYLVYVATLSPEDRAKLFNWNEAEDGKLKNITIRIIRKTLPRVRKSVYKQFLEIIRDMGLYNEADHSKALFEYMLNDVTFIFMGTDNDPQVLRGVEQHILFMNEANELSKEEQKQGNLRTKVKMIYDYNPSMSEHWLYDLEDNENTSTDVYYSTYKDNKFLPPEQAQEIEDYKYTDPETYKVYALGQRAAKLKGKIFSSWEQVQRLPEGTHFWGLDFGYTRDPTAIVKCVKIDNCLYVKECMYDTGVVAGDIEATLLRSGYTYGDPVYCDTNQPIIVDELRRMKINAIKAKKGNNSLMEGIELLKRVRIFVTEDSENLWHEYKNYSYKLRRGGDPDNDNDWLNEPEDKHNHCFVEGTTIDTSKGFKPIENIKEGDLVKTRSGYRKVLKNFNNGKKQVALYLIQLDTYLVYLHCTKDHKIWTTQGWVEIQNLKKDMTVCLSLTSEEKDTIYTKVRGITVRELKDSIEWYLNTIKAKYQKAMRFTTLMRTQPITGSKTLLWLNVLYMLDSLANKGLKIIQSGLRNFIGRELRRQKSGISQMRVESGINNTARTVGKTNLTENLNAVFVERIMKQDIQESQNTAITTVRQKHSGNVEERNVYDLMIESDHEYFANGVLVHNCIDATRYAYTNKFRLGKESFFVV